MKHCESIVHGGHNPRNMYMHIHHMSMWGKHESTITFYINPYQSDYLQYPMLYNYMASEDIFGACYEA